MKLSLAMMLMTFGAVVTFHTKPAMAQDSASKPLQAGPIILSDTQGVDFSAYMRRLRDDILRNWDPLIPDEASPPQLKKGVVGIRFTILPDGSIGSMKLETASGDVQFDKAAWYAITAEGKFPALPSAFHGPQLEVRMGFFYNTTSSPATTAAAPSRAAAQPSTGEKAPSEMVILSDTQGVDFSDYVRRLHNAIQRNWPPLVPKAAKAPRLKEGVVAIRLTILPDGRIGSMKLESPSGTATFDKAAWNAITLQGQFPALPSEFHGPLLELRLGFFYNTPNTPGSSPEPPAGAPDN